MAKLEIPSIVVQSGTHAPALDRKMKRSQWSLSQQSTFDEDAEPMEGAGALSSGDRQQSIDENDNGNGRSGSDAAPPPPGPNARSRSKSKNNLKLLKRSQRALECTSPPPEVNASADNPSENAAPNSTNRTTGDTQSNNNYNFRSGSLSRGNSMEYTDQSGVDVEQFLCETINKNSKDRAYLMRLEGDMDNLVSDPKRNSQKFPTMTSYQRMLVHRVAAYFGLDHNVDHSGHVVVVTKGKNTRIPDKKFQEFIRVDMPMNEDNRRRSILKRDSGSLDDPLTKSPDRQYVDASRRSKSFEEREEEYAKARRRIFRSDQGDSSEVNQEDEENQWNGVNNGQINPQWNPDTTKLHPNSHQRSSRLTKNESYEGKDTLKANSLRGSVSKSYSFGGYDQNAPNETTNPNTNTNQNHRVLTKQDSGSSVGSRVSPLSSGYKSRSRSDTTVSATPSPSATPLLQTQLSHQSEGLSPEPESEPTVMWVVTNMASVPAGSVLINPQTGQPYTNADGSVYHYNPDNPPKLDTDSETSRQDGSRGQRQIIDSSVPLENQATMSGADNSYHGSYTTQGQEYSNSAVNECGVTFVRTSGTTYYEYPGDTASASQPGVGQGHPHAEHYAMPQAPPPMIPMTVPYLPLPTPAPAQPLVYGVPPAAAPAHAHAHAHAQPPQYVMPPTAYDLHHREVSCPQDMCNYMMGLNMDDGSHRQQIFYCPPAQHFTQGPAQVQAGVGVYNGVAQGAPAPPPPQPAPPRHPNPYNPTDRNGGDFAQAQIHPHSYYARGSMSQPVNAVATYANGAPATVNGVMTLAAPQRPAYAQRPPQMPAQPNHTLNGGYQYPMFNAFAGANAFTSAAPPMAVPWSPYFPSPPPTFAAPIRQYVISPPQIGAQASNFSPPVPVRAVRGPRSTATMRSPVPAAHAEPHPVTMQSAMLRFPMAPELIYLNNTRGTLPMTTGAHARIPMNNAGRGRQNNTRPRPATASRPHANTVPSHQQAALASAIEAAAIGA